MRVTAITLALTLLPAPLLGAPNCKKGKPCGNTCIAASKACHVGGSYGTRSSEPKPTNDTPEPPPETKDVRSGEDVIEGFRMAEEAAKDCGRLHGASPGAEITVQAWIGSDGHVLSVNATDSNGLTPVDTCVIEAVVTNTRFAPSKQTSQSEIFTYAVGDDDDLSAPPLESEPPPKVCRREDFKNFDAFVACRVDQESQPAATPPAPLIDPIEAARQREAAEARAELERQGKAKAKDRAEEEQRVRGLFIGLTVSGSVVAATGAGLMAAAFAGTSGPRCTLGKACGQTCIATTDVCHIPINEGGANPSLLWSSVAAMLVGAGLLIAGVAVYQRNQGAFKKRIVLTTHGLELRF